MNEFSPKFGYNHTSINKLLRQYAQMPKMFKSMRSGGRIKPGSSVRLQ
jgi:signal recognition particle GTPase